MLNSQTRLVIVGWLASLSPLTYLGLWEFTCPDIGLNWLFLALFGVCLALGATARLLRASALLSCGAKWFSIGCVVAFV